MIRIESVMFFLLDPFGPVWNQVHQMTEMNENSADWTPVVRWVIFRKLHWASTQL